MAAEHSGISPGLVAATIAAALLGAVSSLGDWIWARFIPDGAIVPGVVHGLLVFTILALVLGRAAGSRRALRRLLATLPPTGLVLAGLFYPIARALGYLTGLLVTWIGMWLALALLQRWARGGAESPAWALLRGSLAAAGSGLAFWAVSGMWTAPSPDPSYLLRWLAWSFAFWPGFAALLVGQAPDSD